MRTIRKSLVGLAAAAALLLPGCAVQDASPVITAAQNTNAHERMSVDYMHEMLITGTATTFSYMLGSYSIDRKENLLENIGYGTYKGEPQNIVEMYKNETFFSSINKGMSSGESCVIRAAEPEEIFNYYYLAEAFVPPGAESMKGLKITENSYGQLYTFTVSDGHQSYFLSLLDDELYSEVGLASPQKDKTSVGDVKCEYTLTERDGQSLLHSAAVTVEIKLFDTPPYSPVYEYPEEDYTITLEMRIRLTFTDFDDSVQISDPNPKDFVTIID